jgi:putative hydrolase of the HAD superfamily
MLKHLGLRDRFVGIFNSAQTGIEKPHARAFSNVLQALKPQTVWMVGDNPVADIAGAEAAGLPAILVRKQVEGGRHVCADLHEVVRLLEGF